MIDELETERQKKFYNYLKKEVLNKGASIKEHIDALADSGIGMDPDDVAMMREVGNLLQHHLDLKAIVVKGGDGLTAEPKPIWADGEGERWQLVKESLRKFNFNDDDIQEIDDVTTSILNEGFEPPNKKKFVVRRGLVLGYVQSGKTTNFISLISKAADAGYRFIFVLTGITDNLRVQTQLRVDERLILKPAQWIKLTDVDNDFASNEKNAAAFDNAAKSGNQTVIAVVKKNAKRLEFLLDWLGKLDQTTRDNLPILIIDDESDQATPNTGKKKQSVINKLVEKLADPEFMPRNVYVAYTATPFANLLMDGSVEKNLYPRDLVYPIKPGKGYFGAAELFGREALDEDDNEIFPEVNILREVDQIDVEKIRHNRWIYEQELRNPDDSLVNALLWFILATATREFRESKRDFSTMMIHTSSRRQDHKNLRDSLDEYLSDLKNYDLYKAKIQPRLKSLWESETSNNDVKFTGKVPLWEDIEPLCLDVARAIEVKVDNHVSKDRIFYSDKEPFPRVPKIVIGGNTLSRGLTLEGLITSYFLRASGQCDSVLQLGRWFGYRHGYEDLQRVFMPNYKPLEFMEWFKSLALLEADLREQIQSMRKDNITPGQLAIKIRNHPYLAVTAAAKARNAVPAHIAFSNQRIDVTMHPNDKNALEGNIANAQKLVGAINKDFEFHRDSTYRNYPVYYDIPSRLIFDFLKGHNFVNDAKSISSKAWIDYITKANSFDELDFWNVFIGSPSHGKIPGTMEFVPGLEVSKVSRAGRPHTEHIRTGTLSMQIDTLSDIKKGSLSENDLTALKAGKLSESQIFKIRERGLGKQGKQVNGLLGLYIIDKDSKPKNWDPDKKALPFAKTQPLEAPSDLLGISMFFPGTSEIKLAVDYIAIDPAKSGGFDDDEEDIDQLIEEAEEADDNV